MICLTQQIFSVASSHEVSERFSFNFAKVLIMNCYFRELAECHSLKSFLTKSDTVEIGCPVMGIVVHCTIPFELIRGNESNAKREDDFEHIFRRIFFYLKVC